VAGFVLLALGIGVTPVAGAIAWWSAAAVIMGVGMALLYRNLIVAMVDHAPPLWRGRALSSYRYWRDTGYAIGALQLGALADLSGGIGATMRGTAALAALSGLWIALAVEESRPRQPVKPA
jgi:MFS family permease